MSEQRTPEWFAKRCGKFTGSRFADVMARSKRDGKPLKAYQDLIWDLVVERMTGETGEGVDSYSMRWGRDLEDYARQEYELLRGVHVDQIDFLDHPELPYVGSSPDGLVDADGGLEIKCPKDSRVHLERFVHGLPEEHVPQVQGNLWVSGRQWWDFISYDPRMPESHRLLIIRVERDEAFIKDLAEKVMAAELEVLAMLRNIQEKVAA